MLSGAELDHPAQSRAERHLVHSRQAPGGCEGDAQFADVPGIADRIHEQPSRTRLAQDFLSLEQRVRSTRCGRHGFEQQFKEFVCFGESLDDRRVILGDHYMPGLLVENKSSNPWQGNAIGATKTKSSKDRFKARDWARSHASLLTQEVGIAHHIGFTCWVPELSYVGDARVFECHRVPVLGTRAAVAGVADERAPGRLTRSATYGALAS